MYLLVSDVYYLENHILSILACNNATIAKKVNVTMLVYCTKTLVASNLKLKRQNPLNHVNNNQTVIN